MKKSLLISTVVMYIATTMFSGCVQTGTGTVILQITDAPGDVHITHANVTISQVRVHLSAGSGNNSIVGWHTVVKDPQTFDLIDLIDVKEFFGSADLYPGMYTTLQLTVDSFIITVDGTEYNCSVPSGSIKLSKPFVLLVNQTITLTMDFDVQESIKEKGNHQYEFQPVIKVIQE